MNLLKVDLIVLLILPFARQGQIKQAKSKINTIVELSPALWRNVERLTNSVEATTPFKKANVDFAQDTISFRRKNLINQNVCLDLKACSQRFHQLSIFRINWKHWNWWVTIGFAWPNIVEISVRNNQCLALFVHIYNQAF